MHKHFRFGLLFIVIVLLASCGDVPVGLFESIERERKIIDDRGLDNNITVAAMAKASARYFISAGALWYREFADPDYPDTVSQWALIAAPGGAADNYVTQSVVAFDPLVGTASPQIYAVFTDQSGTNSGIYGMNPAATPPTISASLFGTGVTAGVTGLGKLFVVVVGGEDYLLVVAKDDQPIPQYSVYVSSDASAFTELATTQSNFPVIDIDTDGSFVAYLTRFTLMRSDVGGAVIDDVNTDIEPGTGARTPRFGGLFYDGAKLWVSDNEGYLYSDDGSLTGTWTTAAAAYAVSAANEDPLPFTDFAIANSVVVVGSEGYGYRELGATALITPVTPDVVGSNYQASELAKSAVLTFFVDAGVTVFVPQEDGSFASFTGDLLFAGTSNAGLWKALYHAQAPQWLRE